MSIRLNDVQQAMIEKLKLSTTICGKLGDPLDIREAEWQGTKFKFPNVRVRVDDFWRHEKNLGCGVFDTVLAIFVFADDASSLLVNDVASDIFDLLDQVSFSAGSVKFGPCSVKQGGATWIMEGGVWQSVLTVEARVSQK
jgi:hypothetical protein